MPPERRNPRRGKTKNVFDDNINEMNHDLVKREGNSPKVYTCKNCNDSFEIKKLLLQHTKQCKKSQLITVEIIKKAVFSCKECNKKFRFKKSYTSHLHNEHCKLPGFVSCDQCHVRCPDKPTLKEHISKVHEREIFECPECKKQFVRHAHVLRHMAQKGCDGQEAISYPCEICNARFSRKDNLMVHLRLQHIVQKDFQCKHCVYSTRTFSKLIIHMQNNHAVSPPQYECDHCGKVTSSRAAIAKHLEIHGDKKYACDVCGYSTFTIEVMRRHVLTHVKDKPYKCSLCPQSFIQRVQLQRHLNRHSGNLCKVCDKAFTTKAGLLIHTREHMPSKKLLCPFKECQFAQKEMPNEEALTAHINKHFDEKPFVCEVCHKRFHNEMNMRRHMSSHTLERPRRCMYCVAARAYVRGMQLVRHVRKTHPAVFREHLTHVRSVLGSSTTVGRVKKSELESILNVLDAEADRIIQGYGEGVLYGGMQEVEEEMEVEHQAPVKTENSPLMSEEELAENLNKMLAKLVDEETLECFGWPDESVDTVLQKVIEHCGAKPADREKWTRVQCLRENAKHLFLYVVEDKTVARMLHTHTIDQIVKHILTQVSDTDAVTL